MPCHKLAPGYGLLVALISLPTNLGPTMFKLESFSNGSPYTDVLFFFRSVLFFPTPTRLRWRLINPPRFLFFYRARSMDFERKIEGL